MKALTTAKNGFELAEYDLKIRGAGELGGGKQWGVSDIGMEALRNIKMVEAFSCFWGFIIFVTGGFLPAGNSSKRDKSKSP